MFSPDLLVVILIGSYAAIVGFVAYWRGVSRGETKERDRNAERIEELTAELDWAAETLADLAAQVGEAKRRHRVAVVNP